VIISGDAGGRLKVRRCLPSARPAGAYYNAELREFILPYEVVRTAAAPEAMIAAFVDTTYAQAADLAGWDRAALERP
jgi:hypothetical protein